MNTNLYVHGRVCHVNIQLLAVLYKIYWALDF